MIVACIALFVAIGGTATAVTYVVSSNSQVGPGTISGHKPPSGDHANIIAGSINGTDIADRSGVDTCKTPLLAKFGPICAGSDGGSRDWYAAINYCAGFELRLPTLAEAMALAVNHDVPGVSGSQVFWTNDRFEYPNGLAAASIVRDDGVNGSAPVTSSERTVCVTDPSA
jgi:hypothetical protein